MKCSECNEPIHMYVARGHITTPAAKVCTLCGKGMPMHRCKTGERFYVCPTCQLMWEDTKKEDA